MTCLLRLDKHPFGHFIRCRLSTSVFSESKGLAHRVQAGERCASGQRQATNELRRVPT